MATVNDLLASVAQADRAFLETLARQNMTEAEKLHRTHKHYVGREALFKTLCREKDAES